MSESATVTALLSGPDRPGLVARVSGWIFERGGNIVNADQHTDVEARIFFQRVEWVPRRVEVDVLAFREFAASLGVSARVTPSSHRTRVAIFVSKSDHCLHDLALRWRAGEYSAEMVAIVSNHADLAPVAAGYGIPFYPIPVASGGSGKAEAEARQLAVLRELEVELVVLARYMQVLTAEFLASLNRPIINIHHSFLPAFAGGRPYHQAHERGVKLIGATAHYVTAELDEGPIIQQDVVRVTHRHTVSDMIRKGRDLEKGVLSQAVRWHLQSRVLAYGRKTVVFD
jgi:formyltetrahydrofolate deformylase